VSEAAIRLCDIDVNAPSMAAVSALSIFRDLVRIKAEGFTDPTKPQYGANNDLTRAYIVGGSDHLPKTMAASLKAGVRLNSPVVAIEQTDREVETRLANGERLRSRFVVMAAPFSAVRRIRFLPGLPPRQDDAIQGALYSATTQFHFRITKPYWETDGLNASIFSDARFERAFVNTAGAGPHGSLTVWMNGDGATRIDALPLEQQKDFIIAELVQRRPSMAGALEYVFGYSWERNPFVGGNKHVFGAGQIRSFAAEMGKPAGRVHFAGEHLRKLEAGMESAMETGEIAAYEILDKV
jgi:monoamine oxidase